MFLPTLHNLSECTVFLLYFIPSHALKDRPKLPLLIAVCLCCVYFILFNLFILNSFILVLFRTNSVVGLFIYLYLEVGSVYLVHSCWHCLLKKMKLVTKIKFIKT